MHAKDWRAWRRVYQLISNAVATDLATHPALFCSGVLLIYVHILLLVHQAIVDLLEFSVCIRVLVKALQSLNPVYLLELGYVVTVTGYSKDLHVQACYIHCTMYMYMYLLVYSLYTCIYTCTCPTTL